MSAASPGDPASASERAGGRPSRWSSSFGYVAGLAAIWVLLWGSASPANVLGGLAVGVILVAVVPGLRRVARAPRIRPMAIARLARHMLANAIRSNVTLIREIVASGSRVRTGYVEVRMPECSDELLTIITSLLALTPGTMPVDIATRPDRSGPHPPTMLVHVLHLRPIDEIRCDIEYLAGLAIRAFGTDESIAALADWWDAARAEVAS